VACGVFPRPAQISLTVKGRNMPQSVIVVGTMVPLRYKVTPSPSRLHDMCIIRSLNRKVIAAFLCLVLGNPRDRWTPFIGVRTSVQLRAICTICTVGREQDG